MAKDENHHVIVEKIILEGRHGPYGVARFLKLGSVTFSLKPPVWNEADFPELGSYVILSQVRKKRAGWYAKHGRHVVPSDEQPST